MSSSSGPKAGSERRAVGLALDLVTAGLVLLAALKLPVIQDEAYYWAWSTRPSATYFDHPPLIAWVLHGTRRLFGESAFAIRLPSLVSMLAAVWLSVRSATLLSGGNGEASHLARRILLASPMFLVGLVPATPDSLLALGTAAAAFFVVRAVELDRSRDWFLTGLLLSVLVGIKHYGALVGLGALAGLLSHPRARHGSRLLPLTLGVSAGLCLLSPWLFFELREFETSSVQFQLDRVLSGRSKFSGPLSVPVAFGSMLGTLGPIAAVALFAFGPRGVVGPDLAPRALYGGATGLVLACFVAVWLGSGEANWPLPALVFAAPVLGVQMARLPAARLLIAGFIGVQVLILIYLLHMATPFLPISLTRDPAARGEGYATLAEQVRVKARDEGAKAIGARSYQLASLLRYHLRDALPVLELGLDRPSQYDRWPRPALCPGDEVVTVTRAARRALPKYLRPLGPSEKLLRGSPGRPGEEELILTVTEVAGTELCRQGSAP